MAQHKIQLMTSKKGHVELTWELATDTEPAASETDEIAAARALFDEHVGKGWLAANVDPVTKEIEQIRAFDAAFPNIVLYPQAAGG